jgi:hypothetical protein
MPPLLAKKIAVVSLLAGTLSGCAAFGRHPEGEPLPVRKVEEDIIVAAWAEPAHLPSGGGSAQLIVRVQKRGGVAYPGVEVRFATSGGSLFSSGNILVTDHQGLTRDRITAQQTVTVTLNAGGTRYRFKVPVGTPRSSPSPSPSPSP